MFIAQPTANPFTPNLLQHLPNTQRRRLMRLLYHPIHCCLPSSHRCQRHKKSLLHLRHFSTPVLLLWCSYRPPPTSPHPDIDGIRDCSIGTVQIGPEEGELWCISIFLCSELHVKLTHHPQMGVWSNPNHPILLQPLANTQRHQLTRWIACATTKPSHRHHRISIE